MRDWMRRFHRMSHEEFAAEVEAHLAHETDSAIENGVSRDEARYLAVRRFGNVTRHLERFREGSPWFWLETLWQDIRYSVRALRRAPWFSAAALASLAIGIGLNTVLFSGFDAVLFRPLPYPEPDRLVSIGQSSNGVIWPAIFEEWQRRTTVFETMGVADYNHTLAVVRDGSQTGRTDVLHVSSGFLAAFGVSPATGRTLSTQDDKTGSNVAVVSYDWWKRHATSQSQGLGRIVSVDGVPYTIVGVMPPGFRVYHASYMGGQTWTDLFLSDPYRFNSRTNRWFWGLNAIGRLKPGVSLQRADDEIKTLAASTDYGTPPSPGFARQRFPGAVQPIGGIPQATRLRLWLTWGIVAVIMLLASANTANLLLARAAARGFEVGVRVALGASRKRLIRQFLTESVVLSAAGGVGGLVLAWGGHDILPAILPDADLLERLPEAGFNWRVFGFTALVSLVVGVAFGLAPACRSLVAVIPPIGSRRFSSHKTSRASQAVLVAQLATSIVLLAGAGLMITTVGNLRTKPLGFDPSNLLTFWLDLPRGTPYVVDRGLQPDPAKETTAEFRIWAPTPVLHTLPGRLVSRLRQVPGVVEATVTTGLPMVRSVWYDFALLDLPRPSPEEQAQRRTTWVKATPGYFNTLGLRIVAGRSFTDDDVAASRPVVVINQQMARKHWRSDVDALGSRILMETETMPREVIGIVGDSRFWVYEDMIPHIYSPVAQVGFEPHTDLQVGFALHQNVGVRVARHSPAVIADIRRAIAQETDGLPIEHVRWMEQAIQDASGNAPAFRALLIAGAAIALSLAAVGVFGLVSYSVSQRMHEVAIRRALGASRTGILRLLMATAARLALAGTAAGVVGSLWTLRLLSSELYGVTPTDPRIMTGAVVLLFAIVLVAAWLPARTGLLADPMDVLRME